MNESKPIRSPEDLTELTAVCGENWRGEIVEWHYRCLLSQGAGEPRWDPDGGSLTVRLYLHGIGRTLNLSFDRVALCGHRGGTVESPCFEFGRYGDHVYFGNRPYREIPSRPDALFALARDVRWKIEG